MALAGHGQPTADTHAPEARTLRAQWVPFVPISQLLPGVQVVVSTGGASTVLASVIRGIPLVTWPQGADQPRIADRVAAAGAGVVARSGAALVDAVRTVLGDPAFRLAAGRVARQVAAASPPVDVLRQITAHPPPTSLYVDKSGPDVPLAFGTEVRVYGLRMSETNPWAPEACTLPSAEHPVRQQEWNDLFAQSLRAQSRLSATRLHWEFDLAVEAEARDLAERETACCSFFAFDFTSTDQELRVEVEVPSAQVRVLDALADVAQPHPARP